MEVRTLRELVRFDAERMRKVPIFESPHLYHDLCTLSPGRWQRPFAIKRSDKIIDVLKGALRAYVDGEQADLTAGQALCVFAGAVNSLENAGREPVVALVVVAPHPGYAKRKKKRPGESPGAG